MKQNFRFEQERDSKKKQNKQEVIEYILDEPYGETLSNEELSIMLGYNIEDEEELKKYKNMMQSIRKFLLSKGRVLKSIPNLGYYILKPSQVSKHCFNTYIKSATKLYDKSAYVLDRTDKTELNETRKEEINNLIGLNKLLAQTAENLIVCDDIDYFKDDFETEINNFIKDVEVIDIKYAESHNEYDDETVVSALIMYKDKED